ncbi:midcut-by-XrtH protein [Gilvimarinus sp. 1_MG-2023]|uniref:midcut-by-XrtH protein n=1 Tax=Gilvimarinus sp. 1_MG-2023 TaxID=3062638 RepID=UPI0026E38025|nr:midcut-by-XrtH protein [Gilvimarinus sp. 1_MG-2023]MDO6748026.1 midcut-by-XrtH protein [Gilvimarinus sp. 1_MG-2023]
MKFSPVNAGGVLSLLALTTVTPLASAQGVGTSGISALPAVSSISIMATLIALAGIAFFALRNRSFAAALIGPSLIVAGATSMVASPDLRAAFTAVLEFTDPKGEYIDLQPSFAFGATYFEITNTSGSPLRIVKVDNPDISDCPSGKSNLPSAKGEVRLEAPGYPTCTVGNTLEKGSTCSLDFFNFCSGPQLD